MKINQLKTAAAVLGLFAFAMPVSAQKYKADVPAAIVTPDTVETRIGTLKFHDGLPDAETTKSHFCSTCGSTVYYYPKSDPARTGVRVGAFADPTFPPPMGSGFEEYAHPWVSNIAALPMPLGRHK